MTAQLDDHAFAKVYNDIEAFPTLRAVSIETGYSVQTVKNKAGKLRHRHRTGLRVPLLVDRSATGPSVVLPETLYTHREDLGPEELCEMLRQLYLADPSRNITRLTFRALTNIADSTWNRHFGTFQEFRRQAGVEMNRQQQGVERQIAKHASVDHYREFNERHDYADRYCKPNGTRIKTIVGASDLHDIEVDPFYLRVLIETCRMLQPDVINLGGDIFDLAEFGKYGVDPREWDVVGRIQFVHNHILRPLREACPDSQIDFVEGNHEFRLLRHLADATPALRAVLSDLLGLTVPKLLGLDAFEVNYISKANLAAYTKQDQGKELSKSYVVYDEALLVHHFPHAKEWGLPGWNGHHHRWLVFHQKSALRGAYQWMQLGCGHRLTASYCEGEFWSLGFNIAHVNTESKSVVHEYVNVDDFACVGGVYFTRNEDECVGRFLARAA